MPEKTDRLLNWEETQDLLSALRAKQALLNKEESSMQMAEGVISGRFFILLEFDMQKSIPNTLEIFPKASLKKWLMSRITK